MSSSLAQPVDRPRTVEEGTAAAWACYREAVRAFGEVAGAVVDETLDLDDVLRLITKRVSEILGVRRCGLHLKEDTGDLFRGRVGHDSGQCIDEAVRRLVVGVPADRFTQEIVESRRPVVLRNAREDPRPIRSTMQKWQVRSVLGVPMMLRGDVIGIMFLDDVDRSHNFTEPEQELSAAFANLAAAAVARVKLTTDLRSSVETMARQNIALRRAATLDDQLTNLVLDGANIRQIVQAVAELTNRPCAVYDSTNVRRATGVAPGGQADPLRGLLDERHFQLPAVTDALAALHGKRAAVIGPFASDGLHHRYLMAPVVAGEDRWGYLVLAEHAARFGASDVLIARRAATIVALEMSAERRAANAEWDAGESLLNELVRGNCDIASLERRAEFVGVDLSQPHVVVLLSSREKSPAMPPARTVAQAARGLLVDGRGVLATGVAEGVVLMLPVGVDAPARHALQAIKGSLGELCEQIAPTTALSAMVSTICRGPADFISAYSEVVELATLTDELATSRRHAVLAVDDLGAGRMLLAGISGRSADRFVGDVLGPFLDQSVPRAQELLLTLRTFLEVSRNVRRCAQRLTVHENTVRYRLARIEELLGLKVASDAEDQLTVQMALMVAALRGRM